MHHTFHIPVMGTGFTIDTPFKVARYGISSVVSLGDDHLIENMRRYYSGVYQEPYEAIPGTDVDRRASRITAYLDLMDRVVQKQMFCMRAKPLLESSLSDYFNLLPESSDLKKKYYQWLWLEDDDAKAALEAWLRGNVTAGSIDVNIMTKADRENSHQGVKLSREYSDAMAALRGFAKSTLRSSVVFSAGLNLHLYSYLAEFDDFYADAHGRFKKKIILKVSDFRSAAVQAKILAKKGIWISEYRIESGLNCGGHAFATDGHLMGPILEEFKERRGELSESLFPIYRDALADKGRPVPAEPPPTRITAQGGVGTAAEQQFLLRYYDVASVGWGSPFLLVPEATAVDDGMLRQLAAAGEDDIYLSNASPLGVRFYNLKNSASEEVRRSRIAEGKPGSPCFSRYLAFNTEYGAPLCVASSQYQQNKLRELSEKGLGDAEYSRQKERVLEKSCICRDLGSGALIRYGLADGNRPLTPAICPGPNIAYFSRICTLKEMVGHIYGRANVMDPGVSRPNMFINEMRLYVRYWKEALSEYCRRMTDKEYGYLNEFKENLLGGIDYYKRLALQLREESKASRESFLQELYCIERELRAAALHPPAAAAERGGVPCAV